MANGLSIGGALLLMLCIDGVMFLGQVAIHNINPDSTLTFMQGSALDSYNAGNYTLNQNDPGSLLPSGQPSISPGDSNLFVDTFTALWNWFASVPGLNIIFAILGGPTIFLSAIAPIEFVFVVGAVWYGVTLFLLVAFVVGRGS